MLPIVFFYEYNMGTYRHINVTNLVVSAVVQYLSSIASYYVVLRSASHVDHVPCDVLVLLHMQHV